MIMQCRGRDDASLPVEQQLRPETCWTGSVAQRSQITRSDGEATWTHDLYARPADKERRLGHARRSRPRTSARPPTRSPSSPGSPRSSPQSGKVFAACDSAHMPPEAAVDAAFPPAEIAAFSDDDGAGRVRVRGAQRRRERVAGLQPQGRLHHRRHPDQRAVLRQARRARRRSPTTPAARADGSRPGSSNFANEGVDQAVSPALWWSASNWANRFSIPITFGLPPDTCDILDPRPPTGFYGSELLAQASLQWSPAYCLDKKRFKFQHNQMSDEAGWNLMESGGGAAAVRLLQARAPRRRPGRPTRRPR